MSISNGDVIGSFEPGLYKVKVSISSAPVVIEVSDDGGATYQAVDDATFSVSAVKMMYFVDDWLYRFTVGAGASISVKVAEKGAL